GKALWDRHDNGENLLFREADFYSPGKSKLLPELLGLPDAEAAALAGHLIAASQGPLDAVPLLADLLQGGTVAPLSGEQRGRLAALFPDAPASRTPPAAGMTFGDYELLGEVGRGVSWRVYRAKRAGRVVQLRSLTVEPEELARVLGEAEVGAGLTHPNVLTAYDVGQRDGVIYLATDDAPAGTLTRRLGRLRDRPREAVPLLIQVATAVQFAHQRFVLHRALGPESVVIGADGAARVVGFGLAPRSVRVGRPFDSGPYAAPEVAAGDEDVTPASDVWSIGAMLYEGLTGGPPALGEGATGPVPPWEVNRDADPGLSDIALWCLKADPGQRYPSAAKVAAELERWMAGAPVMIALDAAPPPLPRRARPPGLPWPLIAAGCVALVALVGGAAWMLTWAAGPRPGVPAEGVRRVGPR
ncbi:MAG: serine/threonine-protein kinase, partial [Gemmataceae bacterium]